MATRLGSAVYLLQAIQAQSQFSSLNIRWMAIRRRNADFHFEVEREGIQVRVEVNTKVFEEKGWGEFSQMVLRALVEANRMLRGGTSAVRVQSWDVDGETSPSPYGPPKNKVTPLRVFSRCPRAFSVVSGMEGTC